MSERNLNLSYTDADTLSADTNDVEPLAWQSDALCPQTDPEAFFPDRHNVDGYQEAVAAAKRVCAVCDVAAECLAYAMINDEEFGIWGGKSERERRRLKRRRGI